MYFIERFGIKILWRILLCNKSGLSRLRPKAGILIGYKLWLNLVKQTTSILKDIIQGSMTSRPQSNNKS